MVHCVRGWSYRTYCGLSFWIKSDLTHRWAEITCKRCLAGLRKHRGYTPEQALREGE